LSKLLWARLAQVVDFEHLQRDESVQSIEFLAVRQLSESVISRIFSSAVMVQYETIITIRMLITVHPPPQRELSKAERCVILNQLLVAVFKFRRIPISLPLVLQGKWLWISRVLEFGSRRSREYFRIS